MLFLFFIKIKKGMFLIVKIIAFLFDFITSWFNLKKIFSFLLIHSEIRNAYHKYEPYR